MLGRLISTTLQAARRGVIAATGTSIELLRRIERLVATPGGADQPIDPGRTVDELRRLIGLPPTAAVNDSGSERSPEEELRERFAVLLARSRSPSPPAGDHPAMASIIDELSPDEARILRFLHEEGPQPVLAIRATPRFGRGEETILDHVSLLADRAGCHRAEDGPAYLDNLARLGLVRILDEELVGNDDYDAIRARPEVAATEERISEEREQRVRVVRGHTQLSHLGELLCEICLR